MGRRSSPLQLMMLLALPPLLLLLPTLASAAEQAQVVGPALGVYEETCRPGQVFRRACNYCVCPGTGLRSRATCTTRICLLPQPAAAAAAAATAVKRRFRRAPGNGERCAPNIRYMDDCNLCICSADGIKAHSSCTFAQCPGKPR